MYLNFKSYFLMLVLLLVSFSLQASVKEMEQLYAEQRYQQAYQLGFEHLAKEAGDSEFDMIFGVAAQRAGELDQALFAFERVLMHNTKMQVARFELARTHFMLGNLMTARRHFNQLLEAEPQPPNEAMKRIQWYLAALDAKESGEVVAASDAITRFYLGARIGFDNNPRNDTHKSVSFENYAPVKIDIKSDTFHELIAGVTRYQQQGESWGWFAGANANLRGYHDEQDAMDNYSLGLQTGALLLGKTWRLTVPLQVNQQVRDDDNEVLILALATEFNHRLTTKFDYTLFGQVAAIDYEPTKNRDAKSYTTGVIFSYRKTDQLNIYGGPVVGAENADEVAGKYFGRDLLGVRTGMTYSLSDKQYVDINLNYLNTKHKDVDTNFSKIRTDDQISLGVKFNQRFSGDWLVDLGLQHSHHTSNLNLYNYHRTQVSAGVRKEW